MPELTSKNLSCENVLSCDCVREMLFSCKFPGLIGGNPLDSAPSSLAWPGAPKNSFVNGWLVRQTGSCPEIPLDPKLGSDEFSAGLARDWPKWLCCFSSGTMVSEEASTSDSAVDSTSSLIVSLEAFFLAKPTNWEIWFLISSLPGLDVTSFRFLGDLLGEVLVGVRVVPGFGPRIGVEAAGGCPRLGDGDWGRVVSSPWSPSAGMVVSRLMLSMVVSIHAEVSPVSLAKSSSSFLLISLALASAIRSMARCTSRLAGGSE